MGCLLVLFGLFLPRVFMFSVWIFTDWFSRGFETTIWPLLGFVVLPYTTLAYMAAMLNNDMRLSGGWLALFVIALVVDLSSGGSTASRARR